MLSSQDLSLAVMVLLTISTVGQAAPTTLRVVNGTDSSVQKYPYVVSTINDGHI